MLGPIVAGGPALGWRCGARAAEDVGFPYTLNAAGARRIEGTRHGKSPLLLTLCHNVGKKFSHPQTLIVYTKRSKSQVFGDNENLAKYMEIVNFNNKNIL